MVRSSGERHVGVIRRVVVVAASGTAHSIRYARE